MHDKGRPGHRNRTAIGRVFGRFRLRFRLPDLMWLSFLIAILILWYKDHQSLVNRLCSLDWKGRETLPNRFWP